MKKSYWLILFLLGSIQLSAQDTLTLHKSKKINKLIQLDVGVGAHFDLTHSPSGNMLTFLADRKRVTPAFDFRFLHFFSKRWGWYTDVSLDINAGKRRDCYAEWVQPLETDYYVKQVNQFGGDEQSRVNSYFSVGVAYRIENAGWSLYPRVGIGVNLISYQPIYAELKKKGGNELYRVQYSNLEGTSNLERAAWFVGMSANYKVSKRCFLFLDATYAQPMGHLTLNYTKTDLYTQDVLKEKTYRSSTLGRFLKVTAGVGIPFYLGEKRNNARRSSHSDRTNELMKKKRKDFGLFPRNK